MIGERPSRAALVPVFLALLACLLAFGAVVLLIVQPGVPELDLSASQQLHDAASPPLDALMWATTRLGDTLILVALAAVGILVLVARGYRSTAVLVAVALVASLLLNDALKLLLERPRPTFEWAEIRTDFGFPSGHAMNSTVVYLALALGVWHVRGRRVGGLAFVLAAALVAAVSLSRVYLGVHWLIDVLGGILAGLALLLGIWLLFAVAASPSRSDAQPPPGSA